MAITVKNGFFVTRNSEKYVCYSFTTQMRKKEIDLIDVQILNILQRNGGITNKELSDQVGLAQPNTLKRVRVMLSKGILSAIKGLVNFSYFGYRYRAWVMVRLPAVHVESFSSLLAANPYILTASLLQVPGGTSNNRVPILFQVLAKTQRHLVNGIAQQYAALPYFDMIDFEVYPVSRVIKDTTELELTMHDAGDPADRNE